MIATATGSVCIIWKTVPVGMFLSHMDRLGNEFAL